MCNKAARGQLGHRSVKSGGFTSALLPELAQSLYGLHQRFRIAGCISLLEWRCYDCGSLAPSCVDRHEEIPMDAKLLYSVSRTSWGSYKVDVYQGWYEAPRTGTRNTFRPPFINM